MKSRLPLVRLLIVSAIVLAIVSQFLRPSLVVGWYWASALEKLEAGENDQAIELGQKALEWSGDSPEMHLRMAELLYRAGRNEEARELLEKSDQGASEDLSYLEMKSFLLSRLGDHQGSIAVADKLIEQAQEGKFHLHRALNIRAYSTALAWSDGADLPKESLDQALEDIDQAIKIYGAEASYLDTRGYVKHFAGDNEGGLNDLNIAIEMYEASLAKVEEEEEVWGTMKEMRIRQIRSVIGVLYHHRGETLQALGRNDEAESDLKKADQMGYSRLKGHW
ncbi:tetratricopeptide repeat protein [Blastopirellula sp. JC732]|uniref:Tetratricopeptide repeat protein n=1 Tax=Blastopirellula sediminis TaxID=2894196 RepID=A0A9X1MRX0_9BACT|nr:tetratricopeptide repeat protein [Blastopirellula sediminis]MCC9605778.1 tetratricopeptide repeat protein [Blastopirellula sediminis]MCC9630922.1 tetratricopeptide repeat protein [Blastopirellula sediminis]